MGLAVAATVVYGIAHDGITARVCLEHLTGAPAPLEDATSAFGRLWEAAGTLWIGLVLGLPLAGAARLGAGPRLGVSELVRPVGVLLGLTGSIAFAMGLAGYWLSVSGRIEVPAEVAARVLPGRHALWMGDWWAHNASYLGGVLGGGLLVAWTLRTRRARGRVPDATAGSITVPGDR